MYKKRKLQFDFLGPIPVFMVVWICAIFVPYLISDDDDPFFKFWPYQFINESEALTASFVLYLIVLICYVIGIKALKKPTFEVSLSATPCSTIKIKKMYLWLYLIISSTAVMVLLAKFGGFSALIEGASDRTRVFAGNQYLVILVGLINCIAIAQFIVLCRNSNNKKSNATKFLLFFLVSIFATMASGSKYGIFTLVLVVGCIYHYSVKRLKPGKLLLGTSILYFILIVYHLIKQEYLAVGEFISVDVNDLPGTFFNYAYTMWSGNFFAIKTMGIIYEEYPRIHEFMYGETFLYLFTLMIPSAIYPDKPLTVPGIFTLNNWPNRWLEEGTTLPTGVFGEVYMNFGIPGLVLYSFVFGVLMAYVYNKMIRNPCDSRWLIIYACSASAMLGYFRGEFAAVTLQLLLLIIPTLFLVRKS